MTLARDLRGHIYKKIETEQADFNLLDACCRKNGGEKAYFEKVQLGIGGEIRLVRPKLPPKKFSKPRKFWKSA